VFNAPVAPQQASNFSGYHDAIFWTLTGLTAVFTVLVFTLVIVFAVRFRRGTKVDRSRPHHENLPLELTWSGIPLLLGLVMFFFGADLFIKMRVPPADAQEIFVIGKQWMWHIQHPNGVREMNTLHVPVGKPVKLTMISQDVLHAFYIPDFRVQMHVVPGRYTQLWFTATKAGRYPLFCGMYCGTQHSEMGGSVYAMDAKEYAAWLANGGNNPEGLTLAQKGGKLYKVLGCDAGSCHGPANTPSAPSLYGLYGGTRQHTDGSSARVDEAYIREAILRPWNRLTAGYENTMPMYEGQVAEEDVLALTAYIRSLATVGGDAGIPEAQKGQAGPSSGPGATTLSVNAIESEQSGNLGETNPARTGNAVNAIAAENRN
jgi:cytochrome c oxidase subunit 2